MLKVSPVDLFAAEVERVEAAAAVDRVIAVARIPDERVVAGAEERRVGAFTADDRVVASPPSRMSLPSPPLRVSLPLPPNRSAVGSACPAGGATLSSEIVSLPFPPNTIDFAWCWRPSVGRRRTDTAPLFTKICPAASRLIVMVLSRLSPVY